MRLDYFAGMRPLLIAATAKTPQIEWNDEQSTLTLSGRSIPENAVEFYRPVLDWTHGLEADTPMTVMVQLEYFNTSSSKCLLDLFKRLETSSEIQVKWHFDADDEDMLEAGEDYDHIVSLPFTFIEVDPGV